MLISHKIIFFPWYGCLRYDFIMKTTKCQSPDSYYKSVTEKTELVILRRKNNSRLRHCLYHFPVIWPWKVLWISQLQVLMERTTTMTTLPDFHRGQIQLLSIKQYKCTLLHASSCKKLLGFSLIYWVLELIITGSITIVIANINRVLQQPCKMLGISHILFHLTPTTVHKS